MEHSAGNALAMTDIDELRRTLFVNAGTSVEPKFDLRRSRNPEESLRFIKGSLDALSFGYATAKAFIGLSEMTSSCERGPLRTKFQAPNSYTLDKCLQAALEMVEAYGRVNTKLADLHLRHSSTTTTAEFPKGYLGSLYVQMFLYELLLNISKHGHINPGSKKAPVDIASRFKDGALEVICTNPVSSADNDLSKWDTRGLVALPRYRQDRPYKRHSFLELFDILSHFIPGVTINTRVFVAKGGGLQYRSVLVLGGMDVEVNGHVETKAPFKTA